MLLPRRPADTTPPPKDSPSAAAPADPAPAPTGAPQETPARPNLDRRALESELEQLAATHRRRLFAIALQFVGRAADADDVVQDALLRAHRSLASFRGQCALHTWLYRITVNRALSHRRRRARTEGAPLDDDRVHAALAVDAAHDPHLAFELRERYALLLTALDRLPTGLRATVVLVTTQALSLEEAGQVLGCTGGTVGWRLHEARRLLQHMLAPTSGVRPRR